MWLSDGSVRNTYTDRPDAELMEATAYLDLSDWNLAEALRRAREDEGWVYVFRTDPSLNHTSPSSEIAQSQKRNLLNCIVK